MYAAKTEFQLRTFACLRASGAWFSRMALPSGLPRGLQLTVQALSLSNKILVGGAEDAAYVSYPSGAWPGAGSVSANCKPQNVQIKMYGLPGGPQKITTWRRKKSTSTAMVKSFTMRLFMSHWSMTGM